MSEFVLVRVLPLDLVAKEALRRERKGAWMIYMVTGDTDQEVSRSLAR